MVIESGFLFRQHWFIRSLHGHLNLLYHYVQCVTKPTLYFNNLFTKLPTTVITKYTLFNKIGLQLAKILIKAENCYVRISHNSEEVSDFIKLMVVMSSSLLYRQWVLSSGHYPDNFKTKRSMNENSILTWWFDKSIV